MRKDDVIKLFFILMIGFVSCKREHVVEPEPEPHAPYTISYGETLYLPSIDLKIGFRKILEDSRCPMGVLCCWQGRARIDAWMKTSGTDTITFAPTIYGYSSKEDTLHHIPIDTLGYRMTLLQLDPYPVYGDTTHTMNDYTALINIVKKK